MDFRGRKSMMVLLLLLHAFPGVALIVGVYLLPTIIFFVTAQRILLQGYSGGIKG